MVPPCPDHIYSTLLSSPYNVSRETFESLKRYISQLINENTQYNLIGRSTVQNIWERHILDSIQLLPYIPIGSLKILDVGSGAGLPGIVLSLCLNKSLNLLDARQKKCRFLENVSRETNAKTVIFWSRIEDHFDVYDLITSRGFASLNKTFSLVHKNIHKKGALLLLKGKNALEEIEEAKRNWDFQFQRYSSITNKEGSILHITQIQKKHDTDHQYRKSKRGGR